MRKRSLGFAIAAMATLSLATAAPAQAHDTSYDFHRGCGFGGFEDCGHAWVSYSHRTINICDDSADGDVPYVSYVRGGVGYRLSDPNGGQSGCGSESRSAGISRWRMCVDYGSYDVCIGNWIDA